LRWRLDRYFLPIIIKKEAALGQTVLNQFKKVLKDPKLPFPEVEMIFPDTRKRFQCKLPLGFCLALPINEFSDISFEELHPDYGNF
jgi:hypothetical protein